jgi:LmbE family N-acetylglucosaminyl deacetylase
MSISRRCIVVAAVMIDYAERLNILAIGAHPDDIELGCGGLLLKAVKRGHNVFMYALTRGGASGDPEERTQELIESSEFIGARSLWVDNFEDTKLSLNSEIIDHIEYFIDKSSADVIYTHSCQDNHHDHRMLATATIEAARYVPNVLAYEMPLTREFKPQVYYDISDVIQEKIELINLFKSQKKKMFLQSHAIKGLAQYRALQSRLNPSITSVEAFEVIKISLEKDFRLRRGPQESISEHALLHSPREVIEYIPHNNRISESEPIKVRGARA